MKSSDERNEEYEARELAFADWCTADRIFHKVATFMASGQLTTGAIIGMISQVIADADPEKGSFSPDASNDKALRAACKTRVDMVMSALRMDFDREHAE